jgi:hypothetical protein
MVLEPPTQRKHQIGQRNVIVIVDKIYNKRQLFIKSLMAHLQGGGKSMLHYSLYIVWSRLFMKNYTIGHYMQPLSDTCASHVLVSHHPCQYPIHTI